MAEAKVDDGRGTAGEERRDLSPEARAMLEWVDGYTSRPLTDEEHARWEERARFAEENPLTLRGGR